MVQLVRPDTAVVQAKADGPLGKTGAVAQPHKPLLRRRRDQLSIAHEAGSGIPMPGVDAENVHLGSGVG